MPSRAQRQAEAAQRRARVVQLRTAGATFEQIGRELGITDSRAHQLYADALARTVKVATDEHRDLEERRLDRLQVAAEAVLRARHVVIQGGKVILDEHGRPYTDHAATLNAINTLLRIGESRRRLHGLDAPTRVDASITLRVAWDRASPEERMSLIDLALAELTAELDRTGPPTPPPAETIDPPDGDPDPEQLAAAVEAALDAAQVPPDRREAAYQAVERQLQERGG